jgi:hypothetical protein
MSDSSLRELLQRAATLQADQQSKQTQARAQQQQLWERDEARRRLNESIGLLCRVQNDPFRTGKADLAGHLADIAADLVALCDAVKASDEAQLFCLDHAGFRSAYGDRYAAEFASPTHGPALEVALCTFKEGLAGVGARRVKAILKKAAQAEGMHEIWNWLRIIPAALLSKKQAQAPSFQELLPRPEDDLPDTTARRNQKGRGWKKPGTKKGKTYELVIAGLTKHHQYENQ